MRFQPLEKLINLHDGYRRRIKIDSLDLLLLQEEGKVYVVESRCPHQEHPLIDAEIEDGILYCPLHQFGFDLVSGRHIDDMCQALMVWSPVFEDREVGIVLPAE